MYCNKKFQIEQCGAVSDLTKGYKRGQVPVRQNQKITGKSKHRLWRQKLQSTPLLKKAKKVILQMVNKKKGLLVY